MTTTKPRALGIMMAISLTLSGATAYSNRLATSIECSVPGPDGLFVTSGKHEYADSENACVSMGGSPVDLNDENFPIASEIIQSCAGSEKAVWIGSWDYEPGSDDCQDCLSVFIGKSKPGGGVVDQNCSGPKPVLCQVGSSVVKHDPDYQLGTDAPRKINIVPSYGAYREYGDYPPSVYTGNTPIYYPGYYGERVSPPHGPKGGFPGGVFPGGPGFGGGYGQNDWKKKKAWKHSSVAPTTVTVAAAAAPAAPPETVTVTAAAAPAQTVIVTAAPAPAQTVTVTEYAETVLTNIELVTKYETETDVSTNVQTVISTDTATQYVTNFATVVNTVTQDVTELLTTTELSVREGTTVTLDPNTVTLNPVTVTQGAETITIPASTITLDPGTVTLPPDTITLSPVTVTKPAETSTKTLPPVTSVVYAVRDNTITTTMFSRLPAITSYKTEYQIKYSTSTIITTEIVPGPTVTATEIVKETATVTVQPAATGGASSSGSNAEWMFPFELPQFEGPGQYTLSNGAVITVKNDGTYSLLSGTLPSSSGSPVTGNAGADFKFPFTINNFGGPGSYTLSNGAIVTVKPGGAYTFLAGGPPTSSSSSGSEVSFSFPFNVPNFQGPGLYTISPGNVMTVKNDGSYAFLQGGPPKNDNPSSSSSSGNSVSFSFPFNVPGFSGPGEYTLSPGNVVLIKPDGSYAFVQGGPPSGTGGGGGGGGGGGTGGSISLPFNIPGFKGPGVYTLSPGNVVSIKNDGSYTFLQGGPPSPGGGGGGGGNGGSISLPFNIPGFKGPGVYTLSPGNVVSIKNDGSYTFLQGGPPSPGGGGGGGGGNGGSISLPFNIPGFKGPGTYTLSPGNVVSIKADGSYTFLQGGPPGGSSSTPGGAFSLPFDIPGFSGPGTYTISPGNVVSIKGDGSYTFLQGGPPSSGGSTNNGGSISLPFNIPGFKGPGTYTLSPGNVVSIKADGSYTFLQGGPPPSGLPGSAPQPTTSVSLGPGINIPNYSGSGVYTLFLGDVISINNDGVYSYVKGQGILGEKTGSFGLPKLTLPSFSFSTPAPLFTFSAPSFSPLFPLDDAQEEDNVELENEGPEIVQLARPSAEQSGFDLASAVSFPAFARRAIATFV